MESFLRLRYTFSVGGKRNRLAQKLKKTAMVAEPATETSPMRTAGRFPMQLPLRIVTVDGVLEAVTENISANGILFTGEELPPVDSRIEFTVKMPAAVMGASDDVLIQCIGRVIRHQMSGTQRQAAAIIDEYFLRV